MMPLSVALPLMTYFVVSDVVGRAVRLDSQDATIVGVMPVRFENQLLYGPIDVWRPFAFTPQQRQQRPDRACS